MSLASGGVKTTPRSRLQLRDDVQQRDSRRCAARRSSSARRVQNTAAQLAKFLLRLQLSVCTRATRDAARDGVDGDELRRDGR